MAALGAQSIASSYEQLLHVDADGGGNGTTHVSLKDGDNGTTFPLTLATDAVMVTSTNRLEFGDNASYIHQSADGVLDLVSDTEIELTATTIDINGAAIFDSDVTIGTGDIVFSTAGKGICLGVTSNTDANTLDDYEEGTWTPQQDSAGTDFGATPAGKYIKIGGKVDVWFDVTNWDSDDANIYNLPFTSINNTPAGSCDISYNGVDSDTMGRIDANTTKIILSVGTGQPTVNSSSRFIGHATYRA